MASARRKVEGIRPLGVLRREGPEHLPGVHDEIECSDRLRVRVRVYASSVGGTRWFIRELRLYSRVPLRTMRNQLRA